MVGSEGGFVDLQGAFEGGFRPGMIPQVFQHHAQIVDIDCYVRMVGSEGGFIDLQSAFEGGFRPGMIC